MLKSVLAMFCMASSIAWANPQVTFINPWKPGGNADHMARVMAPVLEKHGVKSQTIYTKSCAQALDLVRAGAKDNFIILIATAFIPLTDTSYCNTYDIDRAEDAKLVYSSIHTSSYSLCVAPGKTVTTADLSQRSLRVGVWAPQQWYLDDVLANMKSHKITPVPYAQAGEMHRAAIAGDIDLWFGLPATQVSGGQEPTCLVNSARDNPKNLPFVGSLTQQGNRYPEMKQMFLLIGNAPSPQVDQAMRATMRSPEFMSYVQSVGATHGGLGKNTDNSSDLATLHEIKAMHKKMGK